MRSRAPWILALAVVAGLAVPGAGRSRAREDPGPAPALPELPSVADGVDGLYDDEGCLHTGPTEVDCSVRAAEVDAAQRGRCGRDPAPRGLRRLPLARPGRRPRSDGPARLGRALDGRRVRRVGPGPQREHGGARHPRGHGPAPRRRRGRSLTWSRSPAPSTTSGRASRHRSPCGPRSTPPWWPGRVVGGRRRGRRRGLPGAVLDALLGAALSAAIPSSCTSTRTTRALAPTWCSAAWRQSVRPHDPPRGRGRLAQRRGASGLGRHRAGQRPRWCPAGRPPRGRSG